MILRLKKGYRYELRIKRKWLRYHVTIVNLDSGRMLEKKMWRRPTEVIWV